MFIDGFCDSCGVKEGQGCFIWCDAGNALIVSKEEFTTRYLKPAARQMIKSSIESLGGIFEESND